MLPDTNDLGLTTMHSQATAISQCSFLLLNTTQVELLIRILNIVLTYYLYALVKNKMTVF